MQIMELDPADEGTVSSWLQLLTAAGTVDLPDFPPLPDRFWVAGLSHPWPGTRDETWVAVRDGQVLGVAQLSLPIEDNLHNVELELVVHPGHRRQGVGRALYAKVRERAAANGRTNIMAMSARTLPGSPVSHHGAGDGFARAMGAECAMVSTRRRWRPGVVADAELEGQLAAAWARAEGYELVIWRGAPPEHLLDGMAYLDSRMLTDMPLGDLDYEPQRPDTERIRADAAVRAARGLTTINAAMAKDGKLTAFTTLAFLGGADWHGSQFGTLVDPDHRGHRLGTVLKLEVLRVARADRPALRAIDTWNNSENVHMIAINEAMGFRSVDTWANWQHKL